MTAANQQSWATPGDRRGIWSAVLFADLVGYSRMMSEDELGTLEFMVSCSRMINEVGQQYGGTLVQTTGDGFLLLFESSGGAVDFGIELHNLVAKRQANVQQPALFRVGIHEGRVFRTSGMIHGHAVNVAARLESEALPGTCVVSQAICDAVSGTKQRRGDQIFESIGSPPLKNIPERLQIYRTIPKDGSLIAIGSELAQISVIGGLDLRAGPAKMTFSPGRTTAALFGFLALSSGQSERDGKVASVLWPDRSADARLRAFADCRRRLSSALKWDFPNLIYHAKARTGLNEIHFDTDLVQILNDLRRGRVARVLIDQPDWPSLILDGFERANPVFTTWLRVQRSSWRHRMMSELASLQARCKPEDDVCRDAAHAILTIEPGNEIASAALIQHHGIQGNRAAAITEYDRLSGYLSETHDLRPSARVEAARRGATDDNAPIPSGTIQTTSPVRRRLLRIVVEPFSATKSGQVHRIDGFRSELVSNLARFREWSVIEGTTHVENVDGSAAQIAVNAYAIGAAPIADDRFSLSLRDLAAGRILWTDEVLLNSENWVANQRNVVGRIAAHLETYISCDRLSNVIGTQEHQATTHDRWLNAERIFARWTPDSAQEADGLLRAVIAEDPAFAPAYSSLASFCNVRHIVHPGSPRDADDAREANDMARRAVDLDPLDARNHLSIAWTAGLTGAFDRAAIHLDMAATLNPNCQSTLISCSMGYAFFGQADRGETLIDHVLRIAPMLSEYQWCYVAAVHFLSGRYEDALKAARMSGDRIVDNQGWIAATFVQLGRLEEAKIALDALIDGVRPVWVGKDSPTAEAVYNWFSGAYPLKNEADRERLSDSLQEALRGQ